MNITLHFYIEEKLKFLQKNGYEVKQIDYEMAYPVYHDDMEYEIKKIWAVYKNDKEYLKPGRYSFGKEDWLNMAFENEIKNKLSKFILNL